MSAERLRLVNEKLIALQKEVDIEMKIRDGLEKICKAKQAEKSSKSKKIQNDMSTQLEKNNRRLDALKHELQKRRLQFQALQQASHSLEDVENKLRDIPSTSILTSLSVMTKFLANFCIEFVEIESRAKR